MVRIMILLDAKHLPVLRKHIQYLEEIYTFQTQNSRHFLNRAHFQGRKRSQAA